jgi:hypothetical protein
MAGAIVAVVVAAVTAAALVRPDGTPPANSAPMAGRGDQAAADPAVTVGVGGVGGPTSGATSGQPGQPGGEPGAIDPRQADPPVVTTPAQPGVPGTPTTTTTTVPPESHDDTQMRYGNTVTIRCVGASATITSAVPAENWSVTRITPGPAEQVNLRFESATVEPYFISLRARCNDGYPRFNW